MCNFFIVNISMNFWRLFYWDIFSYSKQIFTFQIFIDFCLNEASKLYKRQVQQNLHPHLTKAIKWGMRNVYIYNDTEQTP